MHMSKKIIPCFLWLPPLAWSGLIYWLSGRTEFPEPNFWLPPFTDKLIHAVIYAILSCLLYPALRKLTFSPWTAAYLSILLASLYGITDEWHQSLVVNRSPDVLDWVADTIGACFVLLLVHHRHSRKPTTHKHE